MQSNICKATLKATTKSTLQVRFFKAESSVWLNTIGPVVNMIMWSGIEACASTICANLPCYAPLLKRGPSLSYIFTTLRSLFTSPRSLFSRRNSPKGTFEESTSTERFASEPEVPRNTTIVEGGIRRQKHESDLELGQIRVETTVGARQMI